MADIDDLKPGDEVPSRPPRQHRLRAGLGLVLRWEALLVVLLGATIAYGASVSPYFLQSTNLFYICLNVGEVAIMALPLTLIVITGEIDLSVASMLGLCGVAMAELFKHGWPIWPAMIAAVALGAVLGAFNGFLVTRVGLPSLAVTIGTLTLYRGIAQGILPTDTIGGFPAHLTNIGVVPIPGTHIPYSIAFFGALAIVFAIVLHATPLGRSIFAIGANQEAAFFAGIRVKRIKFWLYVLCGVLCGFAGVLWTLRFASARYDAAIGQELYVVTIVLLGGISIFGGRGTIAGVVLAVAVLGCLQTALTADLVPAQDQQIVVGALLLASVIVPNAGDLYRRARERLRSAGARRHRAAAVQAESR
ncbi:MAG TPA: ABC transporter permease [Gaiellaceae bacterium]|nr:ABC transporter permease [Gaiellaceae bacterium]